MPRVGVTYDDVSQTIHVLEKVGLNPSIRMIREKLGKGSLTTIAEHKRTFEGQRNEGPTEALPDPIAKGLLKGATTYWQELVDAAEGEIGLVRAESNKSQALLTEKLSQATAQIATLHDELGSQTAVKQQLEQDSADLTRQLKEQLDANHDKDIVISRLQADYDASRLQQAELKQSQTSLQNKVAGSDSERARLAERIENLVTEYAKEKATLQKQLIENKDMVVTLSNDIYDANDSRRESEKYAATADKKVALLEKDNDRLNRELFDVKIEVRGLIENLGELRGQLLAADEYQVLERTKADQLLNEKNERVLILSTALEEAQRLVRQYVPVDAKLSQELIDERSTEKD